MSSVRAPWKWLAGAVVLLLGITAAVLSQGVTLQQLNTPVSQVWVTRDAGQYARVNTSTGEIDTVRTVADPNNIVQHGTNVTVLSDALAHAWPVNAAQPQNFQRETDNAEPSKHAVPLPSATREVQAAGGYAMLRTADGEVYASALTDTPDTTLVQQLVTPQHRITGNTSGAANSEAFRADAASVSSDGTLALYSGATQSVRRYSVPQQQWLGDPEPLSGATTPVKTPQITVIGDSWALLDTTNKKLWRPGSKALRVPLSGPAKLQDAHTATSHTPPSTQQRTPPAENTETPTAEHTTIEIADAQGLLSITADGTITRTLNAQGTAAQPTHLSGTLCAAWLGETSGTLRCGTRTLPLEYDTRAQRSRTHAPVFRSNGDAAVLNDTVTGMVWTLPEGTLIPLAQWDETQTQREELGATRVSDATEQLPPIARDDRFGARPGQRTVLPVLLNDSDPNPADVLTVVADSLDEHPLPVSFGTVTVDETSQAVILQPDTAASGTATFSYRVTDGVHTSAAATVTLTIAAETENSAPQWCPASDCQQTPEIPAIAPGGTLVTDALSSWVDPEGDPFTLSNVRLTTPEAPLRAMITADGRLALHHTDSGAGGDISLRITVSDARGAETVRELTLRVNGNAAPEYMPGALTAQRGETLRLDALARVSGGSGNYQLIDATLHNGNGITVTAAPRRGEMEIEARDPGTAIVRVTVRDAVTQLETIGVLRITTGETAPTMQLPPLNAFVHPLSDTIVDIPAARLGATTRPLSLLSARPIQGAVQTDILNHAQLRIISTAEPEQAVAVGSVEITVGDGTTATTTTVHVFTLPSTTAASVIARNDTTTAQPGTVSDIDVLNNDLSSAGDTLILTEASVHGAGAGTTNPAQPNGGTGDTAAPRGGIAFVSGSTLRYQTPTTPGEYTLSYTVRSERNPNAADTAEVHVTVLPNRTEQPPEPPPLLVRLSPDEQQNVAVPLSGSDPNGGRVTLLGAQLDRSAPVSVTVAQNSSELTVRTFDNTAAGIYTAQYTVANSDGVHGTGTLTILVAGDTAGPPVALTDTVDVQQGSKQAVAVLPLANDSDPARGTLRLISVTPNVPGGSDAPEYRRQLALLDTTARAQGVVSVQPDTHPGVRSYRYRMQSDATHSTAEGILVVRTTKRVTEQPPTIDDTIMTVRDRAQFASTGIDVVSHRTHWGSTASVRGAAAAGALGDDAPLQLSLVGADTARYRVQGQRIIGEYPDQGGEILFRLTAERNGAPQLLGYGLLVMPPFDSLRITSVAGAAPLRVDEGKTRTLALSSIADIGERDLLEARGQAAPVSRTQARCEVVNATQLQYHAGEGAPWNDECIVQLRVSGQRSWSTLAVPVTVVPRSPQVSLTPLSLTIAPGQSTTVQLNDMVRWQGGNAGATQALRFQVNGGGEHFDVQQSTASLRLTARASVRPGDTETLNITVSGAGDAAATLTLRAGEAPTAAPRGGSVTLNCTVGEACSTKLVGVAGEFDPFSGKPGGGLTLRSVQQSQCSLATVQPTEQGIAAVRWNPDQVVGGTCTFSFTVRDAQGRSGSGTLELNASGIAEAPTLQQSGFTERSITFTVTLSATPATPEVSAVRLEGPGAQSCTALSGGRYECTASGVRSGERHEYRAFAINSVGTSAASQTITAWAYRPPQAPVVTATPVKNPENTDQNHGGIQLTISGSADTARFQVSINGVQQSPDVSGPNATAIYRDLPAGSAQLHVVPVSSTDPPPGLGGTAEGSAATSSATVIGAPRLQAAVLSSAQGSTSATVQTTPEDGGAQENAPVTLRYTLSAAESEPAACLNGQTEPNFTGLSPMSVVTARVCASSDYGRSSLLTNSVVVGGDPDPVTMIYRVNTVAQNDGVGGKLYAQDTTTITGKLPGARIEYRINGQISDTFVLDSSVHAAVQLRQCVGSGAAEQCSRWSDATFSGAPTTVELSASGVCATSATPSAAELRSLLRISAAAAPYAQIVAAPVSGGALPLIVSWDGTGSGGTPSPFAALSSVEFSVCIAGSG